MITVRGQILVSRTGDDPLRPVCPCTFKTFSCVPAPRAHVETCARGARTHGDVLNVHTEPFLNPHTFFFFHVFSVCRNTHKTHTTTTNNTTTITTQHHTTRHTTSHGDREDRERETEKERQRQRKRDRERERETEKERKRREEKRREEKRREEKRREEKRKREEKRREEKRREEKRREEKRREEKRREEKRRENEEREIEMIRNERKDVFFFQKKKKFQDSQTHQMN